MASDAAPLGGAAAVVRHRRDVADQGHLEADPLKRAEGALAAGAGSLHEDRDRADPVLHGLARRLFRSELGRERGALARALEPPASPRSTRPTVLPFTSVIVTTVLLNVASTCATPE